MCPQFSWKEYTEEKIYPQEYCTWKRGRSNVLQQAKQSKYVWQEMCCFFKLYCRFKLTRVNNIFFFLSKYCRHFPFYFIKCGRNMIWNYSPSIWVIRCESWNCYFSAIISLYFAHSMSPSLPLFTLPLFFSVLKNHEQKIYNRHMLATNSCVCSFSDVNQLFSFRRQPYRLGTNRSKKKIEV